MEALIRPMLAQPAKPFDLPQHLFEVKWDGIRSLAAVEHGRLRLWGRQPVEHTDRYPELDALRALPSGTVLDGELVRLRDGRADLGAILARHQLTSPRKIRCASRHCPAVYIVFDVLSQAGRSLLDRPLADRREVLAEIVGRRQLPQVLLSAGVVGPGQEFFGR